MVNTTVLKTVPSMVAGSIPAAPTMPSGVTGSTLDFESKDTGSSPVLATRPSGIAVKWYYNTKESVELCLNISLLTSLNLGLVVYAGTGDHARKLTPCNGYYGPFLSQEHYREFLVLIKLGVVAEPVHISVSDVMK